MGLFDFFSMMGNYEQRKVDRYDQGEDFVSTARVMDSRDPYETGIYRAEWGHVCVVETYPDKETAQKRHHYWVEEMKQGRLPRETPQDMGTSDIAILSRTLSQTVGELEDNP